MRVAGVSRLITRVYVLSLNRGHGAFGPGACPRTKSEPEPENSIVFRLSAPNAFDALLMTELASGAPAAQASSPARAKTTIHFLPIPASCTLAVSVYPLLRG